jgi:hypothetical protein
MELLRQGLAMIDPQQDPKLTLNAVHNLAWLLADTGLYAEARRVVSENRSLYAEHGGALGLLRLYWLEGRVNAGLDHLTAAEHDLRAAYEGFEAAGLSYPAAIVALDLAAVELRQDRPDYAEALAHQAVRTFGALEIGREARKAVCLLEEATRRRSVN